MSADTTEAPTREQPSTIEEIIVSAAEAHGVDPDDLLAVARCESTLDPAAVGDRNLGVSRGLFQINRRWHPEVSDAEAFDPAFAADWAARMFAKGRAFEWTCARDLGIA